MEDALQLGRFGHVSRAERFTNLVQSLGVFERQVWRPSLVGLNELHLDLCDKSPS
jgi:hypothetical protein